MKSYDYIITGGGASGLLTAYRMVKDPYFTRSTILIIEKEKKNSNDRTWCFWESGEGEWDAILETSWEHIIFKSEEYTATPKIIPYRYKMIRSARFYERLLHELQQHSQITFITEEVTSIKDQQQYVSVATHNSSYKAKKVLNSILFDKQYLNQKKYPVLQQHFVGWFIETKEDTFDAEKATFMDFTIPQQNNTRFMYVLPLSSKVALFEYTLFSANLLKEEEYESGIKAYLEEVGIKDYNIIEKEKGVIPMTSYPFWKQNTKNILHIGTAGGWSKASTGFTFRNISINTNRLLQFLKSQQSFTRFHKKNRFWRYDLVLLDVLSKNNAKGASVFSRLFRKNKVQDILQFLDEETSFKQELNIMQSLTSLSFIRAFLRRLFV